MIPRIIVLGVTVLLTACSSGEGTASEPDVLTGTVLAVDARSLTDIESFTLKTADDEVEIAIDDDRDYSESGFLPQHLREHVVTAVRVRVEVERLGGRLVAVAMEDA